MNWMWRKLGVLADKDIRNTERVLYTLLALGGAMVVVIVVFGVLRGAALWSRYSLAISVNFIFWALATAFVAFLTGGLIGMLFGLPTARRVEITNNAAGGTPSGGGQGQVSTGYVESTSLEQIADALVKGLVVLSLATFDAWVRKFDLLAANVTMTLMGPQGACAGSACLADRVPGGLLLAGYALLGFLVGYLWMRRWFIAEMVTARIEERDALRAELRNIEEARNSGRTGTGTSLRNDPAKVQASARQVAAAAVAGASDAAATAATQIEQEVTVAGGDPDDPWKGLFGGTAAQNGCALTAKVSALKSDPDWFQVDLLMRVIDPERLPALAGKTAHYYLHPTFGSGTQDVTIGADGTAPLQVFSYGAFTVGVLIDDTKLEFDLAKIPGAPRKFVER